MAAQRNIITIVIDAASDVGLLGALTDLSVGRSETRLVVGALRWVGRDVCRAGLIQREFTFYTASGQASYPLPSDYYLPVTDTTWNRGDQWFMRNIPQTEWQANKSGFTASQVHQRFRVQPAFGTAGTGVSSSDQHTQRRLYIDPTPDAAEKIVFNYRSGYWAQDSTTDAVEGVTLSGSNEVKIDATGHALSVGDVVAFYGLGGTTELNGNVYTVSATDTNDFDLLGTSAADFTAWTSGGEFLEIKNTAGAGVTTFPLFPEDLLEVGLSYRLRQRMGMSYLDHKMQYEEQREAYKGALHGDHRINLGGGRALGNYPGIPEGNYPSS